jgi:hypothetical protein
MPERHRPIRLIISALVPKFAPVTKCVTGSGYTLPLLGNRGKVVAVGGTRPGGHFNQLHLSIAIARGQKCNGSRSADGDKIGTV